jgi:hypothetical protein
VLLLLLAPCVASAASRDSDEYVFVPDPQVLGAALLEGATWKAVGPGFALRLQRLDEEQRRSYIQKVAGTTTDPFATPPDKKPHFLTFLMELRNSGGGSLVFRSQQCWLVTDKEQFLYPMGLEALRGLYGLVDQEPSPAYERTAAAFVPATHTLEAGPSLAGLLVYSAPSPKAKRFQLEIQITSPSGDVALVKVPYRRVRENREGA